MLRKMSRGVTISLCDPVHLIKPYSNNITSQDQFRNIPDPVHKRKMKRKRITKQLILESLKIPVVIKVRPEIATLPNPRPLPFHEKESFIVPLIQLIHFRPRMARWSMWMQPQVVQLRRRDQLK